MKKEIFLIVCIFLILYFIKDILTVIIILCVISCIYNYYVDDKISIITSESIVIK